MTNLCTHERTEQESEMADGACPICLMSELSERRDQVRTLTRRLEDSNDVLEKLINTEATVRAWHKIALQMRDLAIAGDNANIEKVYFDAAMTLPFYGAEAIAGK